MYIARLNSEPELFYSLQGEGIRSGCPSVFLRLAGCNLSCIWCDTKHSWKEGIECSESYLVERILAFHCPNLVITGGEPLLQAEALERLLALLPHHIHVEVETNATQEPTAAMIARVNQWNVSPKLGHAGQGILAIEYDVIDSFMDLPNSWFKFVIEREEDWDQVMALGIARDKIVLMPCAATRELLDQRRLMVAELCIKHGVRYSDRLHIALWDTEKGV